MFQHSRFRYILMNFDKCLQESVCESIYTSWTQKVHFLPLFYIHNWRIKHDIHFNIFVGASILDFFRYCINHYAFYLHTSALYILLQPCVHSMTYHIAHFETHLTMLSSLLNFPVLSGGQIIQLSGLVGGMWLNNIVQKQKLAWQIPQRKSKCAIQYSITWYEIIELPSNDIRTYSFNRVMCIVLN
jgi:hypothetical protein